jgi:hypothetical protein
MGTGL